MSTCSCCDHEYPAYEQMTPEEIRESAASCDIHGERIDEVAVNLATNQEMVAAMGVYRQGVGNLIADVGSGSLGRAAALERAETLLQDSFESAYRQGLKSVGNVNFTTLDKAFVNAGVKSEMKFLERFVDDVSTRQGFVPYGTRAGWYGRGYQSMYTAGQVQGLPWETDIYWRLGGGEHCVDCISLNQANPYTKATVPTVPGAGATKCIFNCGCHLEYKKRPERTASLETPEGQQAVIDSFRTTAPAGKVLPSTADLVNIRQYWGAIQQARTGVRYADDALKGAYVASRRAANAELIAYLEKGGIAGKEPLYWTRGMEDALFNPPPGGGVGGGYAMTGRTGIRSDGTDIAVDAAAVSAAGKQTAREPIPDLGEPVKESVASENLADLSKAVQKGLQKKADDFNDEMEKKNAADWRRTTARTLAAVFKRGVGAYKTNPSSVRPSVKSADQWAYARVNSFLFVLKNDKFRSGKHDTDLLPAGHPLSSKDEARYDSIDFSPPKACVEEAKLGIKWYEEGYGGDGLVDATIRWARRLARGEDITPEKARKMNAWLARHAVDKKGKGFKPGEDGYPSAGRVAWALWCGDPGVTWSAKLVRQMDAEDEEA